MLVTRHTAPIEILNFRASVMPSCLMKFKANKLITSHASHAQAKWIAI
ncbi:MAG: hypothetical protein P4L67_04955 [Candidatus Pacebacteria bacterium]|nr:hypothetical protein [Candidatus Paceibacterota bacterium]